MDITEFWLRLLMVKGLHQAHLRRVCNRISGHSINSESIFRLFNFTSEQQRAFKQANETFLTAALQWLSLSGNSLITYADEDYPEILRHIKDPPLALFVSGARHLLDRPQLAMVGCRNNSYYGEHWGRYFAFELASAGLVITSGLALGIDSICHQAVLDAKGATIAVLGSGLANITPRCHQALAERIVANNGALVSEFLPGEPAIPQNFPKRNRIISGLSQGVLIVEAQKRSGSLITARCALEQGREIFALPGPLGNDGCAGTHWLIQQGAYLVMKPSEVIECLTNTFHWLSDIDSTLNEDVDMENEATDMTSENSDDVLSAVGDEITTLDTIVDRCGCAVDQVLSRLLELELIGYITTLDGGYVRLRTPGNK